MSKLVLMLLLNCAAAERATIAEHALIRQAPQTEALLTDTPQQTVSVKRGKGSRTTALESVGKSGAAVVGGPVAAAAVPYVGAGAAKAVHLGRAWFRGTAANPNIWSSTPLRAQPHQCRCGPGT